ncbi:hypothetical protein ACGFY6_25350 [Streptomyces sp. NPDC048387]|uniref:hypothetical protein n=1 Tax=Streptomyces sp. NPDC048387 TaxID=3365542 RepID=UPI00371B1CC0
MKHSSSRLDPLAERAVLAACALADASGPDRWSAGAIEDAATALEVLAGALSGLSPRAAELLEVVPAAVAALRAGVEHVPAEAAPAPGAGRSGDPAVLSTALRRVLAVHNLAGRVHQLGPALLTITMGPAHAQALAALLAVRRELPRQTPAPEDEPRWGGGPADTAAASLAAALAAYGPETYARVLASGDVSAGLTPSAALQVTGALDAPPARTPAPASRPRRRGLGYGWKGIEAS